MTEHGVVAASRVGIAGSFDDDRLGSAVLRRVLGAELAARLPAAAVRWFAPNGALHPSVRDEGRPAESLIGIDGGTGDADPRRIARALATELDLLVLAGRIAGDGGALLVAVAEAVAAEGVRVAWEFIELAEPVPVRTPPAEVSAVDAESMRALQTHGVRVIDVPRPANLLSRHITVERLATQRRLCELAGWLGSERARLLVDGTPERVGQAVALARSRDRLGLTIIAPSAAHEPAASLRGRTRVLPWYAGVEAVAAVAATAFAYAGDDPDIAALAAGFGVPSLDSAARVLPGSTRRDGREVISALVDARLDAVVAGPQTARVVTRARTARRRTGPQPVPSTSATAVVGGSDLHPGESRSAADQVRLQVMLRQLELRIAALEERLTEIPRLEAEVHKANAELRSITGSKTWRYTERARHLYRGARRTPP